MGVISALNEARATIIKNPVRYATLPNAQAQIFTASGALGRPSGAFMLTPDLAEGLGPTFRPRRPVADFGAYGDMG